MSDRHNDGPPAWATEPDAAPAAAKATPPSPSGTSDLTLRESAQTELLYAGLVTATSKFETPQKNATVTVPGKYTFHYATLDALKEATHEGLAEGRLAVLQPIISRGTEVHLLTRVIHASGQWMEGSMRLPAAGNDPKQFGSNVTYYRRYCYAAMLNIVADDDDDATASTTGNGAHHTQGPPRSAPRGQDRRNAVPDDRPPRQDGGGPRNDTQSGGDGQDAGVGMRAAAAEGVAKVLGDRAKRAEGISEGHALLDDWLKRSSTIEQLRGTAAWEGIERDIGAGLKRTLGTEPAAAFVAALRAAEPAHIEAMQKLWEGKWAEAIAAMQQEAPETYALLRRHVAAQIARVRGGKPGAGEASASGGSPAPAGQPALAGAAQ
jgi:ERF superfamily